MERNAWTCDRVRVRHLEWAGKEPLQLNENDSRDGVLGRFRFTESEYTEMAQRLDWIVARYAPPSDCRTYIALKDPWFRERAAMCFTTTTWSTSFWTHSTNSCSDTRERQSSWPPRDERSFPRSRSAKFRSDTTPSSDASVHTNPLEGCRRAAASSPATSAVDQANHAHGSSRH
jgi:hypothetical protein